MFEKENVATTWSPKGNASKLTNLLDEIEYAVKEKNADRVESMMPREIFVNTDLLEDIQFEVDVDDPKPRSKSRAQNRNCTIYNIHNDDLEKDKLLKIIKDM